MALLSDIVPIRGTEGLGERWCRTSWAKNGARPSWTGRGETQQGSRAKRRRWGQDEGRCENVGEDSVEQERVRAGRTDRAGYTRGEMCLNRMWPTEKLQESWIFSTCSSPTFV